MHRAIRLFTVTSAVEPVARHNQLDRSTELTGYGTKKIISYEVQPTSHQEREEGIRDL